MSEICAKGCILNQFGGIYRCWWFLFGCYNERHGEKDWGTMRRDGSAKPVHAVIATLNRELGDAKLRGEITGGNGTRKFLYEKPDGSQTVVFWRETFVDAAKAAARPVPDELPVEFAVRDGSYRMVDVMGTPSKVPASVCDAVPAVRDRAFGIEGRCAVCSIREVRAEAGAGGRGFDRRSASACDKEGFRYWRTALYSRTSGGYGEH